LNYDFLYFDIAVQPVQFYVECLIIQIHYNFFF